MTSGILKFLSDTFLKILNMSMAAVWIILAVILLRILFKRCPKIITCIMWVLVNIRLICPFSFESFLSLVPSSIIISPNVIANPANYSANIITPATDSAFNSAVSNSTGSAAANYLGLAISILSLIWIAGIISLLSFAIISFFKLRRKVRITAPYKDNVLLCDTVESPFILGIFKPKIYLPSDMDENYIPYVLAHERAHLFRKDYWLKPLAFFILSLHWFNPLCWVGYILMCRDIEFACDERAVKHLGFEKRRQYSQALLDCSTNRHKISACPLAFGETGVMARIKNVLSYKKPAFWLTITAILACIAAAVCLMTNQIADAHVNNSLTVIETCSNCDEVGIVVQSASVDNEEVSIKIIWDNRTNYTVEHGSGFFVYKYQNDEWQRLDMYENTAFTAELIVELPNSAGEGKKERTYIPTFCYNLSDAGKYRLAINFSFDGEEISEIDEHNEYRFLEYTAWVDFELS